MEVVALYNRNHEHMADVKKESNHIFIIKGVENTALQHISRRGNIKDLKTFKEHFELYNEEELPEKQSNIFDYI